MALSVDVKIKGEESLSVSREMRYIFMYMHMRRRDLKIRPMYVEVKERETGFDVVWRRNSFITSYRKRDPKKRSNYLSWIVSSLCVAISKRRRVLTVESLRFRCLLSNLNVRGYEKLMLLAVRFLLSART